MELLAKKQWSSEGLKTSVAHKTVVAKYANDFFLTMMGPGTAHWCRIEKGHLSPLTADRNPRLMKSVQPDMLRKFCSLSGERERQVTSITRFQLTVCR